MQAVSPSIALLMLSVFLLGCSERNVAPTNEEQIESEEALSAIPKYEPRDQALYDSIVAMDKKYFEAYNSCDLETQADIIADDMEFYHDQGGLETDKATLIQALKDNICDKVTRHYVEGSMEVYAIPGYGAVAEGYHSFFNKLEPDLPSKASKFITIWRQSDAEWQMTRIVSLH